MFRIFGACIHPWDLSTEGDMFDPTVLIFEVFQDFLRRCQVFPGFCSCFLYREIGFPIKFRFWNQQNRIIFCIQKSIQIQIKLLKIKLYIFFVRFWYKKSILNEKSMFRSKKILNFITSRFFRSSHPSFWSNFWQVSDPGPSFRSKFLIPPLPAPPPQGAPAVPQIERNTIFHMESHKTRLLREAGWQFCYRRIDFSIE